MSRSRQTAAWIGWLFVALVAPAAAVEPFFAAAVSAGSIEVDLHAVGGVTVNTPTVASFGVPFPRESITTAGLSTLRVLDGGVEIPANPFGRSVSAALA